MLGFLLAALGLLVAPDASALPVTVHFEGTVQFAAGAVPDGIEAGTAFSGTFSYWAIGLDSASEYPWFELRGARARLTLDIGGHSFVSESRYSPIAAWYTAIWIDPRSRKEVAPDFPDAVLQSLLNASGAIRPTGGYTRYVFGFVNRAILPPDPDLFPELLPASAGLAAQQLQGALLEIGNGSETHGLPGFYFSPCSSGGSGMCVRGRITHFTPVPEPTAAALVLAGCTALAALRRRRRGSGVSPPCEGPGR